MPPTREIQPEIWLEIFKHLRRIPPPTYGHATWEDLHQQHLTVISRVSSAFHEIAVPLLYTSMVVDRLPLLLDHVDDAPATLNAKITSKRDRLKLIRTLRLSALGPAAKASWSPASLLERGNWDDIAESKAHQRERISQAFNAEIAELRRFFGESHLHAYNDSIRLPAIESVIIGQAHNKTWRDMEQGRELVYKMGQFYFHIRRGITMFIIGLRAKTTCVWESYGPYSVHSGFASNKEKGTVPTWNFHHYRNDTHSPVILGTNMQHFYNGAANAGIGISPETGGQAFNFKGTQHLAQLWESIGGLHRHLPGRSDALISVSKVRLFGLYAPVPVVSKGADGVMRMTEHRMTNENEHVDGEEDEEVDLSNEVDRMEDQLQAKSIGGFKADLAEELGPEWKGLIEARKLEDTPCCEACGWDPVANAFEWW